MSPVAGDTSEGGPGSELTPADLRDLRRLAGLMIPAAPEYRLPGADDAAIFADIVRSLGRDKQYVRQALAILRGLAAHDFSVLTDAAAATAATALLRQEGAEIVALGRSVLQCYYRDDRVMRSLGLEPRAPFPKGHILDEGDWSLLDAVRGRPRMWRDVDDEGS